MNDRQEQEQKVGANSTGMQAGRDINYGLTLADMKQLAADLFEAQFLKLQGVAADVARERADAIREDLLEAIRTRNPEGVEQAADVDFQHALYGVQRDYARSGDADLGKLLVDLLIERSKTTERDIMQLVLNQSLEIAAKLTNEQVRVMATVFMVMNATKTDVNSLQAFLTFLDSVVVPFAEGCRISRSSIQYMISNGCGTMAGFAGGGLGSIFLRTYPALFRKGFNDGALPPTATPAFRRMLIPCLHDSTRMQVRAADLTILKQLAAQEGLSGEETAQLEQLFNSDPMSDEEVEKWITDRRPALKPIMETWVTSGLNAFHLTSVGIAIGHACLRQRVPDLTDLSVWVN